MLAKVIKTFESDDPKTQELDAVINTVGLPNAKSLFEHHYLSPLEEGDLEPSENAERIAALEAQANLAAEEKASLTERIAALEAQVAAIGKKK